jgi:hypothetical protein
MLEFIDSEVHTDDIDFSFIENKYLFNSLSEHDQLKEIIRLGIASQVHYVFIYKNKNPYQYLRRHTTETYWKLDKTLPREKHKITDEFILEHKTYRLNPKVILNMYLTTERYVEENSLFFLERFKDRLNHLLIFANTNIEKIDILKEEKEKLRKEYSKLMEHAEELIISFENPQLYAYDDLKENIICSLQDHFDDIEVFLFSGNVSGLHVPELWLKAELTKKQIMLCSELINSNNPTIIMEKTKTIDTSLQVLLFEQIMQTEDWDLISSSKKGQLLSLLISKNDSNIKKVYLELEKKQSQNSKKILEDRIKASEIIKKILG